MQIWICKTIVNLKNRREKRMRQWIGDWCSQVWPQVWRVVEVRKKRPKTCCNNNMCSKFQLKLSLLTFQWRKILQYFPVSKRYIFFEVGLVSAIATLGLINSAGWVCIQSLILPIENISLHSIFSVSKWMYCKFKIF